MQYQTNLRKYLRSRLSRQIKGQQIDFIYLSDHDDVNLDLIKEYPESQWDWESLQIHPNFSLEWLISFPEAPWDWATMHYNEKFEKSWLIYFSHKPWNWQGLHNCEKFQFDWIENLIDAPWDWNRISEKATIDVLKRWPHFPWLWQIVTAYSDISAKSMVEHLEFPWDVSLIRFDEITFEEIGFLRHFMNKFPDAAWIDFTQCASWNIIKRNRDLYWYPEYFHFESDEFEDSDIDFLTSYPIEHLNWTRLSMTVPFRIIKQNLDLPWNFEWVSANDTVEWTDVEEFPNFNWDLSVVPCEPIEQCLLKWVSASKIKRAWRKAISNPEYKMCRERLSREFTTSMPDLCELSQKRNQDPNIEFPNC